MRKSAQTQSVKPHILSWLQRDPAAGVQPFVFTPNLSGKANKPHRSHLITRACLASTTSEFLLVDRGMDSSNTRSFLRFIARLFPFRFLAVVGVICMTWPTTNTSARALEEAPPVQSINQEN
jgi:hypothetical protein